MISQTPLEHNQRLKNLKGSLRQDYRTVEQANRKSHQKNERLYNRKAKLRNFHAGNLIYLINPTVKHGLSRKFHKVWSGPFRIIANIFDMNYEIVDHNNKKQIVQVNSLKQAETPTHGCPRQNKKQGENPILKRQYIMMRKRRKKSKLAPSR